MNPSKLELLTSWLPTQPWYTAGSGRPVLTNVGGFRLDDPRGAVGMEFMVVTDRSGDQARSYHVPLSYRGEPLDETEGQAALLGTSEHGVLGTRWVYDGTSDPALVTRLLALLQSQAEPQAQSMTNTPDPSVTSAYAGPALHAPDGPPAVTNGPDGTDVAVAAAASAPLTLRVVRALAPENPEGPTTEPAGIHGRVTAAWPSPDGGEHRGPFALLHDAR